MPSGEITPTPGSVVLITGAGHGLGLSYAGAFAAAGCRVVIAEMDERASSEAAAALARTGADVFARATDVANEASVMACVEAATERFGGLDILVNNAAIFATVPLRRAGVEDVTVAEWDRTMAVNLRGTFLCSRAVVPTMRTRGGGRIINISSGTALHGGGGWLDYITSKAGVLGFTRALARELGPMGITVNAVAPGNTPTEATSPEDLRRQEATVAARAIQRMQVPNDIVGAVLFLASPAASFITGQTLVVDGGRVMN